jgi:probable lipoprotein NlpC
LRVLLLFAAFTLAFCAPLKPLSPPQSSSEKPSKTKQKPTSQPSSQNSSKITGISAWDNVLSPWLGTPYLPGGSTKNGADCSGFVSSIYREKEGMYIPRSAIEEFKIGRSVDQKNLIVGDLVFFGERGRVNHVGIYVGNGNFIHASTSRGVMVSPMDDIYWKPLYMGARRYL